MRSRSTAIVLLIALVAAVAPPAGSAAKAATTQQHVVIEWNQTMLSTFATGNVPAPAANRLGGIVQAAVFDAVNGIERRYTPIHVRAAAAPGASVRAAAANAAYTTLVALFPKQQAALDAALAASLAVPDDDHSDARSFARGLEWGKTVAEQIVAWRAADGFGAPPPPYVPSNTPGIWQPTPGGSGGPKFQQLATTTPFVLISPSQFRPAGPPPLNSPQYTASFAEVKALGGATSSARTAWETETARFWQLDTPVAAWDRVADTLSIERHLNLLGSARLLALVNMAIADATFAIWDAKVAFNYWRPVTAIITADADGNPGTSADATWLPLMVTPYFQEYPSAHSGISSAAARVLASEFGEDTSFTMTSAGLPGVERSFTRFTDAVAQVGDARVFAGFHFRFSCDDAIVLGASVASYVEAHAVAPLANDDDGGAEGR